MQGLAGKAAVVTGASRGIGLGIAQRLVAEGARVCLTARKPEALAEAVAALGGPDHAIAVAGKADDPDHRAEAVDDGPRRRSAASTCWSTTPASTRSYGPLVELDLGAARKIVEVNCLGALAWVQEAHRAWMAEHGGADRQHLLGLRGPSPRRASRCTAPPRRC